MKKMGYIIGIILVVILTTGCSYERYRDRAVSYLKDAGYSCEKTIADFSDNKDEDVMVCCSVNEGVRKEFIIRYDENFYVYLNIRVDEVLIPIEEKQLTKGLPIPFYKDDVSYGSVYTYRNGNKSYNAGAKVIDDCIEENIGDNEKKQAQCYEVSSYLDLVNSSLQELQDLYNDNDIPVRIEKDID